METLTLAGSEGRIRAALERLRDSPRELGCFVVIAAPVTKRFVQFCTPPIPSRFAGSERLVAPHGEPLIFDGTGNGKPGGFEKIQEFCDVDRGTDLAVDLLARYLPADAEIVIIEEATHRSPAS